jgi:hypothetical protein
MNGIGALLILLGATAVIFDQLIMAEILIPVGIVLYTHTRSNR